MCSGVWPWVGSLCGWDALCRALGRPQAGPTGWGGASCPLSCPGGALEAATGRRAVAGWQGVGDSVCPWAVLILWREACGGQGGLLSPSSPGRWPLPQRLRRVLASQPGQLWPGGGWGPMRPPSQSPLSIVSPPGLSCCPEPGPGPHSCGDALGLRVGAGEREGHRVLTGLRAFWGHRRVGTEPVGVQRALLRPPCFHELVVTSLCVSGQITLLPWCCWAGSFPGLGRCRSCPSLSLSFHICEKEERNSVIARAEVSLAVRTEPEACRRKADG